MLEIFYTYDSFPNCWIGKGGAINWPARSLDLAPCDFFLWGHLKSNIYKRRHPDINSLSEAITANCFLVKEPRPVDLGLQ
jgi:hypothetical protein